MGQMTDTLKAELESLRELDRQQEEDLNEYLDALESTLRDIQIRLDALENRA